MAEFAWVQTRFSFHASYARNDRPAICASSHTTAKACFANPSIPPSFLPLRFLSLPRETERETTTLFLRARLSSFLLSFIPVCIAPRYTRRAFCPAAATRRPSLYMRAEGSRVDNDCEITYLTYNLLAWSWNSCSSPSLSLSQKNSTLPKSRDGKHEIKS